MDNYTTHKRSAWLVHQSWQEVLFLHWPVSAAVIMPLLPEKVEPDLMNDTAWISLVLFNVKQTYFRGVSLLPFLPAYYELNLRTYVTYRGQPGVVFFDIRASRSFPVMLLSAAGLPYHKAMINRTTADAHQDIFFDKKMPASLSANYQLTGTACNTEQDRWLTERYACFQQVGKHTYVYPISHREWPFQAAIMDNFRIDFHFKHLHLASVPPVIHYSPGVNAHFHMRRRLV